jgi:hypothetical protein
MSTNGVVARRGGEWAPPADDYRFDPSVPLEELAEWTKPNSDKHRAQMSDDRVRMGFLNEQALTPEQKEAKDAGYKACQFNQFVSDQLSLHRRGADTRNHQCYNQKYRRCFAPTIHHQSSHQSHPPTTTCPIHSVVSGGSGCTVGFRHDSSYFWYPSVYVRLRWNTNATYILILRRYYPVSKMPAVSKAQMEY